MDTVQSIELRVALARLVAAVEAIWDDPNSPLGDEVVARFPDRAWRDFRRNPYLRTRRRIRVCAHRAELDLCRRRCSTSFSLALKTRQNFTR